LGNEGDAGAGKFKVQNPKFKQTPKFKPMNLEEQESDGSPLWIWFLGLNFEL
jgi:hypothetical protein